MMNPDYKMRPSAAQLLCHPFIRQIERSRLWKLRARRSAKLAKTLINWFLQFFVKIFILICYPFKYLYKTITKRQTIGTPIKSIKNSNILLSNDFDSNYSDDDVFDASAVSAMNNSKKSDISTNSEERLSALDNSFDNSKYI